MSTITAVTTFHQEGLLQYGQKFLNSFAEKVDKNIKLLVYAEDCHPVNPDANQITIFDQTASLEKLVKFKEKWKNVPKANGKCPFPERRPRDHHKEFKWHAIRFANKVYAVFDACNRVDNWCVWIDADTVVHSPWSFDEFKKQLPDNCWLTYVGRGKGSQTWPECGFYGMNLKQTTCLEFLAEFERMYEDADNGIFLLDEWHDSFVFGTILNKFKFKYPNVYDYSAEMYLKEAKTGGGGHPLINTELGKWIDHMKGDRKKLGKSKKSDIMVVRSESYWKN